MHCLFRWLRNPVKALFVPITEAQMDELQGLSEQGCLKASVFVTPGYLCSLNKSPNKIRIYVGPKSRLPYITMIVLRGFGTVDGIRS